jgi:hypothetical protein
MGRLVKHSKDRQPVARCVRNRSLNKQQTASMVEIASKVPLKTDNTPASAQTRQPSEGLSPRIGNPYEDFFGGRLPPLVLEK